MTEEEPKTCLTNGDKVSSDHRDIKENGQQKDYIVLTPEEIGKGYLRPFRDAYTHDKCGYKTHISKTIAETYARKPDFYDETFCCACMNHYPLSEFLWVDSDQRVGS